MNKTSLRPYQQLAIDQLYDWLRDNPGNPCLELPTGSGKSHIIAALCKDAIQNWPETTILVLTHVKELIEQNSAKMREHWPNAPMGIYSAGIGKRQLGESITFAGIQSVRTKAAQLGSIDLVIIDECHLVGHKDEGGYRSLLAELSVTNPRLRVIGLTATPYRLGHGLITDKPAIFDALITPVSIEELIHLGHLAPLRSKLTKERLDTSGVHKRGGEFIESELQAAVDTDTHNQNVVDEVIAKAGDRKAWLFFCAGVEHAEHIKQKLLQSGITAECIIGETPKLQREHILTEFKRGNIRALTNANVLTTGFDYPDIDLIAMLRPTMSPGLYVQMAGRGMRPKSHADHCMVLDFAGVVETHGPITAVKPPTKKGEKAGEAPMKVCENCNELVALSVRICPACGEAFPEPERPKLHLRDDDIMGIHGTEMEVRAWEWRKHISRASGNEMLSVTYYGALSDAPVTEYFPVLNDGYAGQKALRTLSGIASWAKVHLPDAALEDVAKALTNGVQPESIEYSKDGQFHRVIKRSWENATQNTETI